MARQRHGISDAKPSGNWLAIADGRKAIAGDPIASAGWEAQRQRLIAALKVDRQINVLRLRMIVIVNEQRARATAGDISEYDRFTGMLDKSRRDRALSYKLELADLIDRPATR